MKLAYYKRKGLQAGRADGRSSRKFAVNGDHASPMQLWHSRLDTLDCEIYQVEFDAFVDAYVIGWKSVGSPFYCPA